MPVSEVGLSFSVLVSLPPPLLHALRAHGLDVTQSPCGEGEGPGRTHIPHLVVDSPGTGMVGTGGMGMSVGVATYESEWSTVPKNRFQY